MELWVKKATAVAGQDQAGVRSAVSEILEGVSRRGLDAARTYSRRFDDWDPESFRVSAEEIRKARRQLPADLVASLEYAHEQIRRFAELQLASLRSFECETRPGVVLGQKHIPVASAGAYVPGGRYPMLMSAQMSVLTAKVAGVPRVVACTPPTGSNGAYPATLWSMYLAGADEIWCIGGVQALALMAYGGEGFGSVDMITGPGNMYVAEAKRQLFGEVGIDLLAGPTEILVIADEAADPAIVAADLLGQAEHGVTSPCVLVALSEKVAEAVLDEIERQLPVLETREIAQQAWRDCGEVVVVESREEAVRVADGYASEHVEVQTEHDDWYLEHLKCYGTLCLGEEATIAFSDKAIGTNHTLPTARAARYTGGLWVGKFLRTVTYQRCTREGALDVAPHVIRLCEAEQMSAHAASASLRIRKYAE